MSLDDDVAALALRSVLEYWGCNVVIHFVATAGQLVDLLNGETALSGPIILMCHGVEQGLALPELAPQIAARQPYQNVVTATDLREFLALSNRLVLSTGCFTGRPEFADAFLHAGCHAYIGPTDYPEGTSALFYPVHFFYEFHVRNAPLEIAHQKASAHDDETRMFKLYQKSAKNALPSLL